MLLSICIPSYNRFDELRHLLNSITKASSSNFDVFVIDNGSAYDFTDESLNDNRIHFLKREEAVPGPVNLRASLNYGDGKYRMLCLDKDYIDGRFLDNFINKLEYIDVSCGYCLLNAENENGSFQINKTSIDKTIYRCGHPSGYFFRKDVIEKDNSMIDVNDKQGVFYNNPFTPDLLYAVGLLLGKEAIYTGKLVVPETIEKAQKTQSYTYTSNNKNIYFMPDRKVQQFFVLVEHLKLLDLDSAVQKKVIGRLFRRTLMDCTLNYRNIMQNKGICMHHGIDTKDVSSKEMFFEAKSFTHYFYKADMDIKNSRKTMIVDYAWFVLIVKYILKK